MEDKDIIEGNLLSHTDDNTREILRVIEHMNWMFQQFNADLLYLADKLKETQDIFNDFSEKKYPQDISFLHRTLSEELDKDSQADIENIINGWSRLDAQEKIRHCINLFKSGYCRIA